MRGGWSDPGTLIPASKQVNGKCDFISAVVENRDTPEAKAK
jgi:hypothetical protein